jgi:hypothetical protein
MGLTQSTLYDTSSRKFTFEYYDGPSDFWFCDETNYPDQQDTLYKYYKVGLFGSLYTSADAVNNSEEGQIVSTGITYVNSDTTIADFCNTPLDIGNSLVLYNEWQLYVLVVLVGLIGYYSKNDVTRLGLLVVGLVLLFKALGPSADHDTNYWINF